MSIENIQQNPNIQKPKNITCFIHYNETDDLTPIFNILKKFHSEKGLKYTHQKNIIFFTIFSEYMTEFSKVRPFKVSKYQTKSSFKCEAEVAENIMKQKDSFIRMIWDEDNNILNFLSRTTLKVHNQLIKRIFNDSKQNFIKENYSVYRDENNDNEDEDDNDNNNDNKQLKVEVENDDGFTKVIEKKVKVTESKVTESKILKEKNDKPKIRGIKKNV